MSKGSPIRTMRFPVELVERIEAAIDSANNQRFVEPYHWSSWVLKAVTEKLRHLERAKLARQRRRRRPAIAGQAAELPTGNGE